MYRNKTTGTGMESACMTCAIEVHDAWFRGVQPTLFDKGPCPRTWTATIPLFIDISDLLMHSAYRE